MARDMAIHFGWFVRAARHNLQKSSRTVRGFATLAELSDKRIIDIEKMPKPRVLNDATKAGLAKALGYPGWIELDAAWQAKPSPRPNLKDTKAKPTKVLRIPAEVYGKLKTLADRRKLTVEDWQAVRPSRLFLHRKIRDQSWHRERVAHGRFRSWRSKREKVEEFGHLDRFADENQTPVLVYPSSVVEVVSNGERDRRATRNRRNERFGITHEVSALPLKDKGTNLPGAPTAPEPMIG